MGSRRFAIRYSPRLRWLFVLAGLGPSRARVEFRDEVLIVEMGWAFRGALPISSIARIARQRDVWWAIGVHTNLGGSWLVNGSATGIVKLDLRTPVSARSAGFPVTVRTLALGIDEPEAFMSALGTPV